MRMRGEAALVKKGDVEVEGCGKIKPGELGNWLDKEEVRKG